MRRSIGSVLVVVMFGVTGVIAIRSLRDRETAEIAQAKPATNPIVNTTTTVSYGGVSFTYDSSLATKVKSETISEMAEGKPCDVIPEHPSFTLVGYPRIQNSGRGDPTIKAFPLARFREAMSIASALGNKGVVYPPNPPDWTTYFDEEVHVLKALLAAKPPQANIGRFLAKARGQQGCRAAMPFLPMWEACMAFVGHVRYVDFKNGKGVFFLTQWDRETTQINNGRLEYAYQGITNDGRYWVYAEFSVAAPFLPKGDEPEVMVWNEKNYLLSHHSKKYQNYARPVLAKLESLSVNKFEPNLELLEQLIMSLEVKAR